MHKNLDMFPVPKKPRKKARKIMHIHDAGCGEGMFGVDMMCMFKCHHCGYISDWMPVETTTEAKRGKPCPECNKGEI